MSSEHHINRRALLHRGLIAGGGLAAGTGVLGGLIGNQEARSKRARVPGPVPQAPNILIILVDQMRAPRWFQNAPFALRLMPNLARLRSGGVSFARHYTASNDCSPARGVLLTGLYSHQTGCLVTGGSTLDSRFPTWGTMLREQGYSTWWFGKWHLTHRDNRWTARDYGALEPYGFSGGTFPSPNGAPGQGWRVDPHIAEHFGDWFATAPRSQPWCTTVSFVNPHDIAWWYRWSDREPHERHAPGLVTALPPNFETPAQMHARGKPQLQHSLQEVTQRAFGSVPYAGPGVAPAWLPFMDLYLKLLHRVDTQIGQVLDTLLSQPEVARNTVVVFTSDHGEYGASHGMRGKGAAAYEEGIRVPLIVKDHRGLITGATRQPRTGLTSSADIAPLLLSLAAGSNRWRGEPSYAHLAGRHDLLEMLGDPGAPGRPFVLHATDELVTEFATELYAADAPKHVTAIRTPEAKYVTYSYWRPSTSQVEPAGMQAELYDYSTREGSLEIDNRAGRSDREPGLHEKLAAAVRDELREPLPTYLQDAHADGYADYFTTATTAVVDATRKRRLIEATERPARAKTRLGAQ